MQSSAAKVDHGSSNDLQQKATTWLGRNPGEDQHCPLPDRRQKFCSGLPLWRRSAGPLWRRSAAPVTPQTLSASLLEDADKADAIFRCDSTDSIAPARARCASIDSVSSKTSANGFAALFHDRISVTGLGQTAASEVWLFFNAVPAKTGIRRFARTYETFILGLICMNVLFADFNSMDEFAFLEETVWCQMLQYVTCGVFTVEYICRLWSCLEVGEYYLMGGFWGRMTYATQILPLLDLIVIATMYVDIVLSCEFTHARHLADLQALRLVRMLRVVAVLKVERKTNSFNLLFKVLARKRSELYAALSIATTLMVMSASLMYYLENPAQPDQFVSIPASMWWSVTALTTVGYGDMVPITPAGKALASVVSIFGVGLFALPAGILGSGFVEVLQSSMIAECALKEQDILNEVGEEKRKIEVLLEDMSSLRALVYKMQDNQRDVLAAVHLLAHSDCAGRSEASSDCASRSENTSEHPNTPDMHDTVVSVRPQIWQ